MKLSEIFPFLRKKYELSADEYFQLNLKPEDAGHLSDFISEFRFRMDIPTTILAVGSSTFPLYHWEEIKKLNKTNPNLDASETYRDIDLLIVPEDEVKLKTLESNIQETLKQMRHEFKAYNTTTNGVSYIPACLIENDKSMKRLVSYVHLDYSMHSITTNLKNGTKLDLILGREDLIKKTAKQKIHEERMNNYPFSIL